MAKSLNSQILCLIICWNFHSHFFRRTLFFGKSFYSTETVAENMFLLHCFYLSSEAWGMILRWKSLMDAEMTSIHIDIHSAWSSDFSFFWCLLQRINLWQSENPPWHSRYVIEFLIETRIYWGISIWNAKYTLLVFPPIAFRKLPQIHIPSPFPLALPHLALIENQGLTFLSIARKVSNPTRSLQESLFYKTPSPKIHLPKNERYFDILQSTFFSWSLFKFKFASFAGLQLNRLFFQKKPRHSNPTLSTTARSSCFSWKMILGDDIPNSCSVKKNRIRCVGV